MGAIKNKKQNDNKSLNAFLVKSFRISVKFGLALVLINHLTTLPVLAEEKIELVNIFLSDSGSLIIESKDKKQITDYELLKSGANNIKLVLNDSTIDKKIIEDFNLTHKNYKIKNETFKESFFKKQQKVSIYVECLENCDADFEPLLGGLAYKLNLNSINSTPENNSSLITVDNEVEEQKTQFNTLITATNPTNLDIEIEDKDFRPPETIIKSVEDKDVHLLQAQKKENYLFTLTNEESPVEEFLGELDSSIVRELINQDGFKSENFSKADSASLSFIAEKLNQEGHHDLSAQAYAKALSVDPNNLNAMLGLARTTMNEEERLSYYLKTIDDEALISIGQKWFSKGLETGNTKQIAQAMVSYQFAVLKNPENPYYRFEYAKALEKSGFSNFELASKRYLEAAILAKKDFSAGDISKESILRESTECLIKVLTKKGAPEQAVHYCNSYLSLGFKNFLDGRSIKGVMKEISSNKNPFQA